jgi:hypothetical protein
LLNSSKAKFFYSAKIKRSSRQFLLFIKTEDLLNQLHIGIGEVQMNNKDHHKLLTHKLQFAKLAEKRLRNTKFYAAMLISLLLAGFFSVFPAVSSLMGNVTIRSSGTILSISPLHVEGRYIKDVFNNTVVLKGVWKVEFTDSCVGWWNHGNPYIWDETAARSHMQNLKQNWGINVINTFMWGDWWMEDKAVTLGGYTTDRHYRECIKDTISLAAEYGLYYQIRLYSPIMAEGRVHGPYAPYSSWSVNDFVDFWTSVATELKDYPNVIFTLYDEPSGDLNTWFDAAELAINAIRGVGAEQLIVVHYGYCGDCMWMEDWVQQGRPLQNIVFSNHIYRHHGTFHYDADSPVDIDYIRDYLTSQDGAAYGYITDTYNIPVWVSAIGAYKGSSDDAEYIYFRNTLAVLNELELGYAAYQWFRETTWFIGREEPNRLGQALIDSIAGVPVPPLHQLTINANLSSVQFTLDDTTYGTPYSSTLFAGTHTIEMPPSIDTYSHTPLFGSTDTGTGSGGGYTNYMYTAGPYTLDEATTVSTINLYTAASGNAKVALYDESGGEPNNLLTNSEVTACEADSWNSLDVPEVQLSAGQYFIAVKIDTNGMLTGVVTSGFGKYRTHSYTQPFPNPFGEVAGGTGVEYSAYIPLAPIQTTTYSFAHWENGSTDPERTINLTTDMTLTATYELSSGD